MSFRAPDQSLRDILQGIGRIQLHIAGMSLEQFRDDIKTIDAVERNLQRISEAAIRRMICARGFHGVIFGASETGSAINMIESISTPSGTRSRIICRC